MGSDPNSRGNGGIHHFARAGGGVRVDLDADDATGARGEGGGEERAVAAGGIEDTFVRREAIERRDREPGDGRRREPLAQLGPPRHHDHASRRPMR